MLSMVIAFNFNGQGTICEIYFHLSAMKKTYFIFVYKFYLTKVPAIISIRLMLCNVWQCLNYGQIMVWPVVR